MWGRNETGVETSSRTMTTSGRSPPYTAPSPSRELNQAGPNAESLKLSPVR